MLDNLYLITIVLLLSLDFAFTSLMHLNIFIQNRYLQIFDNQLDLKIKTEIEKKTPNQVLNEVFTLTNIQYNKTKMSILEQLYYRFFKVDLKNKYKEDAIHQIKYMKLTHGLLHFSENFEDKFLKSTYEIKQFFRIIGWSYLIIGVIYSLIYIINGYSIFLADKNELYTNGILTLNHFSQNMIGAAKSILFCLLAMSVSKLLKKFLGLHHIEVLCDHIEDNYNFNINRAYDTQVSKSLGQIISDEPPKILKKSS